MAAPTSQPETQWLGAGSTKIVPPADYWSHLASELPADSKSQLERLQQLSDARQTEFIASDLPPKEAAVRLLERVAADGWLERIERTACPGCDLVLTDEDIRQAECPGCGAVYSEVGGLEQETVYIRELAASRSVDWVVAIHGMNTHGTWQEEFSWYLATTWGRSVPVAVYKYGRIITGVLISWCRGKLLRDFRAKLVALRDQAALRGYSGRPDVVAHSFGTWLLGHLLAAELQRPSADRLRLGRVILTGCVLRPDFDWRAIKDAGLVDTVLNHYATKDAVVPLAHITVWDSGPSGRRGFDGDEVINVRAKDYGHSDLLSVDKCVVDDKPFQPRRGAAGETTHLEVSYQRYWWPFLMLPAAELGRLRDRVDPETVWRPLPWPLRGTLFPFVALPLLLALAVFLLGLLGKGLWVVKGLALAGAYWATIGLAVLLAGVVAVKLWRW